MNVKKGIPFTVMASVMFVFLFAFNNWGQECSGFKLKTDLGGIVLEGGAKSLKTELQLSNQTSASIQWRIPNADDLEIIKNCPGILKKNRTYYLSLQMRRQLLEKFCGRRQVNERG